jgi:hypothetical protein
LGEKVLVTPVIALVFYVHFIAMDLGIVYHFEFHSFLIFSLLLQTLKNLRVERNWHLKLRRAGITMNGLFHAALNGIITSILLKFAQFFCQFCEILAHYSFLIKV